MSETHTHPVPIPSDTIAIVVVRMPAPLTLEAHMLDVEFECTTIAPPPRNFIAAVIRGAADTLESGEDQSYEISD